MGLTIKDFGLDRRYDEACFSKILLPDDTIEIIQNWKKNPKHFLVFCGNAGVGKTYLCACFLKDYLARNKWVRYLNEDAFYKKLQSTINNYGSFDDEIRKIGESELLIIDDLGASKDRDDAKQWKVENMFALIDKRYQNQLPTIITSNLYNQDLKSVYGPRTHSRLFSKENTILELVWTDKRQENM